MKVLVTDRIDFAGLNLLEDAGHDVDVRIGLSPEAIASIIGDYDAPIVRSTTKVTREIIEAATRLKIIGRAGVGVDNIDVEAARQKGIVVCNAPTSNIVSVAEHTMALLLSSARRVPQANQSMHAGFWERSRFVGSELYDKTLAIFGLGRIGSLVAERAKAFGMRLVGYDHYCSPTRAEHLGVELYDDLFEVCAQADFITVHMPVTPKTARLFGAELFAAMKDGVYIVNTASPGIFDLSSLADFVAAGKIAGVALDTYEEEPCYDSVLHEFDNVIMTPRLCASTREAQIRAGVQIAEYVAMGLEGRMVPTSVNVASVPAEVIEAVGSYIAAAQMAGSVIAQIAHSGISSLSVDVRGPLATHDVHMLASAALRAIFAESTDDPVNFVNADYIAEQRDIEISVTRDTESADYANLIKFTALATDQVIEVGTTLSYVTASPRIVSLLGYDVDLVPGHNVMVLEYEDKPGKMGIIGTILGKHDINIETMQIGNHGPRTGVALVLLNVDQPLPFEVRTELEEAVGTLDAWYLELF